MLKYFLLFCTLFSVMLHGQNKVTGSLTSGQNTYEWIILYQLKGSSQQYMLNTNITDGNFSFEMPENATPGVYRISYDTRNSGFVDVIFNNEDIAMRFDPENPLSTLTFSESIENILFQDYFMQGAMKEAILDSIQYVSFRSNPTDQATTDAYKEHLTEYKALQQTFEEKSVNTIAQHFIKAEHKYYAPELIESPQEYLNTVKAHYFDNLNLISPVLNNSSLITERIVDYIFYLNTSNDFEVQQQLYKRSVEEVIEKYEGHEQEKKETIVTLLHAFSQMENLELTEYVIENHHNKLPVALQEPSLIDELNHTMRLAIGRIAPDFDLNYKGLPKSLHTIEGAANYIIVFWSSTCPHCLEEMPKLHEQFKANDSVEIIAIALESDEETYKSHTANWKGWTHILGLGKWNNALARFYDVTSTPTYFLLDAQKKIIAKPEFFDDVKLYFEH